jgi:uncharacterized protein (DUF58 family)
VAALSLARRPAAKSFLEEVFSPGILGALERIRMRTRSASGERPGHTPVRGRSDPSGTEIERHTPYTPGDDLRRIDWSSYARLGELLTRRYVAEREVPVWIVVDASASMGPAGPGSKLDMAAAIAAIVATVSLAGGDRVYLGAVTGGGALPPVRAVTRADVGRDGLRRIGPLRGRRRLADMQVFLTAISPAAGSVDLVDGLDTALRNIRRGLVLLISDFLVEPTALERALDVIRTRRCEGKIVQVLSREDRDPSWLTGRDTLIDRETGDVLEIDPSPETLHRYEAAIARHIEAVSSTAAARGMLSAVTVSDIGLRSFLRAELPRLGLTLVR